MTPLPNSTPSDAVERLRQLWSDGGRPDVDVYLAAGELPLAEIAAVLRVDQRERWQTGERVLAEEYLRRHPGLLDSPEAVMDLIYAEFLLREKHGERPRREEYAQRFPTHATALLGQIELHRALAGEVDSDTQIGPAPASTLADATPEMFGRYRILGRLGQGGMATVHLAHDTRLDRRVALKVPYFRPDDHPAIDRFHREARIAAAFTHPNLCRVYDVGEVDGVHFLTMPVIEGESLSARLARDGPLLQAVAARLALQIAEAMSVAHDAGVIHRDLKPGNVVITPRSEPVVMDFGLARRDVSIDPRLTTSGAMLGTPGYCAPEQIGIDPDTLGPACDVYGLGAILYEMLTGRPPFDGPPGPAMWQTLAGEPEPPSRHRTGLDPRLDAICRTALAREPEKRFASMNAFATALREYLVASDRSRRLVPLAALLVVGFGVFGVLGVLAWRQLPPPAVTAVAEDPLRVGARWVGRYQFEPPFEGVSGPVEMSVTRREEEQFWGVYRTDRGDYEFLVRGTARGGEVRWEFTEAVHEKEPRFMVGNARVEGRCDAEDMRVDFVHPVYRSKAAMTLRPAP